MNSAAKEKRFFESYKDWQWVKHLVLQRYTVAWARIVGSANPRIWVVDCFAGAGSYPNPAGGTFEGSPLIEGRAAIQYNNQYAGKRLGVLAIEHNAGNYRSLEEALKGYDEVVTTKPGGFHENEPWILGTIKNDPSLVLVDPIGLRAIPAEHLNGLLQRPGKTDVFINLQFQICHRTAGQQAAKDPRAEANAKNIDAALNTKNWRDIAHDQSLDSTQRERAYLDLYFEHVLRGRYPYKHAYPVRAAVDGATKYWLVHAGANERAFWLMNDVVVDVEKELFRRPVYAEDAMLPFIPELMPDPAKHEQEKAERALARDALAVLAQAGGRGCLRLIVGELAETYFGRVKQAAYPRVVKGMVKAGGLHRTKAAWNAVDPDESLWLPGSSA